MKLEIGDFEIWGEYSGERIASLIGDEIKAALKTEVRRQIKLKEKEFASAAAKAVAEAIKGLGSVDTKQIIVELQKVKK